MYEIDRCCTERNRDGSVDECSSCKSVSSTCSRSLHLPTVNNKNSSSWLSLTQNYIFSSRSSFKIGGLCFPPHPTSSKLGADARKGMKGFSDQGDVHLLKFLYNHHLQWRFANAKAEASMHYQRHESQSKLYSFAKQLSDLRKSVSQKRAEFGVLRRIKTLYTIVESKLSCFYEWANLEEDYSTSLSGTTDALRICSL